MALRRLPFLAALLVAALTGACEPPLHVQLASAEESLPSPAFVIREPSRPEGPRYDLVRVSLLDGTPVWAIRARGSLGGPGPARLVYGVVPDGFEEVQPATPLEVGHTYAVSVSGEGRGGLHVRVQQDGSLTAAP
ncbi:hypothetical protein LXT21_43800 [Myxococcus sp. K38C18041901]|uniref:hypothetical protein n=1 Tax=Myxococcus guangdongensis TaxID=2906760 RepID=UPI0020A80DE7|nr:hypothetical protein [Myxococcus guangdongensis]MCP3065715.1 hypothetical protein [Myxococcus guangdongensis]